MLRPHHGFCRKDRITEGAFHTGRCTVAIIVNTFGAVRSTSCVLSFWSFLEDNFHTAAEWVTFSSHDWQLRKLSDKKLHRSHYLWIACSICIILRSYRLVRPKNGFCKSKPEKQIHLQIPGMHIKTYARRVCIADKQQAQKYKKTRKRKRLGACATDLCRQDWS